MVEAYQDKYFHNYPYEPIEIKHIHKLDYKEIEIIYPGHMTPLLGPHYYKHLPDGHPLKLYKKIEHIETYSLEKYTKEEIQDLFNLFDKNRFIRNVEKCVVHYKRYKDLYSALGFKLVDFCDLLPPDDYSSYKPLFPKDEMIYLSAHIEYSFGLSTRKSKNFLWYIGRLPYNLGWIDYYKIKIDISKYIMETRKYEDYRLNKYTYDNPDSKFEDPVFIKFIDGFLKKNKDTTFDYEFMMKLTYKEFDYMYTHGAKFDIENIEVFYESDRKEQIEMVYDKLWNYQGGILRERIPRFDIVIDNYKKDIQSIHKDGKKLGTLIFGLIDNWNLKGMDYFFDIVNEQLGREKMTIYLKYECEYFIDLPRIENLKWLKINYPELVNTVLERYLRTFSERFFLNDVPKKIPYHQFFYKNIQCKSEDFQKISMLFEGDEEGWKEFLFKENSKSISLAIVFEEFKKLQIHYEELDKIIEKKPSNPYFEKNIELCKLHNDFNKNIGDILKSIDIFEYKENKVHISDMKEKIENMIYIFNQYEKSKILLNESIY